VVLKDGPRPRSFDFAEMQAHLDAHRVAKAYWPERLELVTALPRTPSGKIQKFVLRERARGLDPDAQRKATTVP
jgi:cyclohexanecarboxylate-CoA ligase